MITDDDLGGIVDLCALKVRKLLTAMGNVGDKHQLCIRAQALHSLKSAVERSFVQIATILIKVSTLILQQP